MGRNRPRITVKEKILVHLLDYERYSDVVEVPVAMTQKGMAVVVDVPRSHIALTLGGMLEERLVELEKLRVSGESRRQNAYFLTHQGHQKAAKLRAFFNETVVELVSGENAGEITSVGDILKDFPHLGLIRILNLLAADSGLADSRIDIKDLEGAKTTPRPAESVKEEPAIGTEKPVPPPPPPPPPVEVGGAPPVGPIMPVFRTVECLNCRRTVALQFDGDAGYVACPLCGRGPLVEKRMKERRWAVPLAMGLGLSIVLGSLLLALMLPEACLLYPLGALIGFLIFLWGLTRVGDHDDIGRRALYGAGSALALASIIIFGLVLDFYDLEGVGNVCLVCLPPLLVLLLPRPIPRKQRFCISVVLAVLLIMLGFAIGLGLDVAGWDSPYSVLWVGFGLTSMLLAKELRIGLDVTFWPLMLFSAGIFIVGSVCLTLVLAEFRVSVEHMAAMGAWLVLGLFLISAMAERNNWNQRVVQAMRHGSAFSLGFGFGFFGVVLITAGKYLEGIVEAGIGLPLLWYGAKDAVGNLLPSRLFTIVLLSLVEVTTIIVLVWP